MIETDWTVPVTTLGGRGRVRCRLIWTPDQPLQVLLATTSLDGSRLVEWTISRDVLSDGLRVPAGIADVVVRPVSHTEVALILSSPKGRASLLLPRLACEMFVADTIAAVPLGAEDLRLPDFIPGDWFTAEGSA